MRDGNVTGSVNAPVPALATPFPSMIEPAQSTVTDLENVAIVERSYFLPLAVTNICTRIPTTPRPSAAARSSWVWGIGLRG